jgi:beta-lactamase class A/beta-lactamase class A CARB-5
MHSCRRFILAIRFAWAVMAAVVFYASMSPVFAEEPAQRLPFHVQAVVDRVESALSARVGVAMVDATSMRHWGHRSDERFALTSTFKIFACAALLKRVEADGTTLDRAVAVTTADIVPYSPVLQPLVGRRVSLAQLCEAAVSNSDNAAANLILKQIGGATAMTQFMRSIDDDRTRLDRFEPQLNEAIPGDVRDTTTPGAVTRALLQIIVSHGLPLASRERLTQWMKNNQVAGPLLRAVLPQGWAIADRTGAGGYGSRSIIAVVWPTASQPWVVAIYLTETDAEISQRNAAVADIGQAMFDFITATQQHDTFP